MAPLFQNHFKPDERLSFSSVQRAPWMNKNVEVDQQTMKVHENTNGRRFSAPAIERPQIKPML